MIRAIRISASVLLLIFCIHTVKAEQQNLLSLEAENASLYEVLNSITEQTGVRFSYNPQHIDDKKTYRSVYTIKI